MIDQHWERLKEYQSLTDSVKRNYFGDSTPYAKALWVHFGTVDNHMRKVVLSSIADIALQEYYLAPNKCDHVELEREWKMEFFNFNYKTKQCPLKIEHCRLINVFMGEMQHDLLIRAVVLSLPSLRSSTVIEILLSLIGADVSMYVQSFTVISLQRIRKILGHTDWHFGLRSKTSLFSLVSHTYECQTVSKRKIPSYQVLLISSPTVTLGSICFSWYWSCYGVWALTHVKVVWSTSVQTAQQL